MPRHNQPGKTRQAGHLNACLPLVVSATASGFVSSQITGMSPTQLPVGVCKGLTRPGVRHLPISWCRGEHPASAWQHPLLLNMGLGLPHLLLVGKFKGVCSSVAWTTLCPARLGCGRRRRCPPQPLPSSMQPVPAWDPSPRFAAGPLPSSQGSRGTQRFGRVCGMLPPDAWSCSAHEKQPDMTPCHPSPQTVAPSLCPGGAWVAPVLSPLAVDPVGASSWSSQPHQRGWKTGWGCSKATLSVPAPLPLTSLLCFQLPWGHVLVPMGWGEQQPPLFQGTLKSCSFHCFARDKPSLRVCLLGNFSPLPIPELSFALEPGGEGILEQEQLYPPGVRNP